MNDEDHQKMVGVIFAKRHEKAGLRGSVIPLAYGFFYPKMVMTKTVVVKEKEQGESSHGDRYARYSVVLIRTFSKQSLETRSIPR